MKYTLFGFLIMVFIGCGDKKPTTVEQPTIKTETPVQPESPTYQEQINTNLHDYYAALENKSDEIENFFAPVVAKYFTQKDQRRDKVGAIIRNGYSNIKERSIQIDPQSVKITPSGDTYQVEFKGRVSSVMEGATEKKEEDFHNLFVFDKNYKILEYGSFPGDQAMASKSNSATLAENALDEVKEIVFSALKKNDLSLADNFIDPKTGVIYMTKSGAFPAIYVCKTLSDVPKFSPWMKESLQSTKCEIKTESVPEFDCDDYTKQGCFLDETKDYDRISMVIQGLQENELINLTDNQILQAKAMEKKVTLQLVLTEQNLAMYFGKVDGKWRLLIVDNSIFDCSA